MDKAAKVFLLVCFFLCPLLFFTDLTRNPYVTQIALLNIGLIGAAGCYLLGRAQAREVRLPKTPLDLPLACWLGVCLFTWVWSYFHHEPFFHGAIRAEGLRIGVFTLVNTVLPFYLAAAYSQRMSGEPGIPIGRWAAFSLIWGVAWALFPQMRSPAGPPADIWAHLWDSYGAFIWIAGLIAVAFLMWKGTPHHYWHLALLAGFLSAVYGIFQYFNMELIWPKVLNPYGGRSVSTFGNPNFMSSYMVMLMPVAIAYYLKARTTGTRIAYAAVFLAMEGCLLSSLTRSSWIGALIAFGMLALSKDLRKRATENLESHGIFACLALLILVLWPQSSVSGYSPSIVGRVRELSDAFNLKAQIPYSPLYQRVLIWMSAWMMGKENPLWGKGWGLFELFYPFYQGHILNNYRFFHTMRTHANNSHDEILEIFSQTGILGLGVVLWLWTTFFTSGLSWARNAELRTKDEESAWRYACLAGVAGMLADNLLNVSMHFAVPAFLLWWQVGSAMAGGGAPPVSLAPEEGKMRGKTASRGSSHPNPIPPAGEGGGPGERVFRFHSAAVSWCVTGAIVVACASGAWFWVKQWNREVHYFAGFKLLRNGQLSQAVDELETAFHWHSRDVNADYELGNAYAQSQLYPKAVWAYDQAFQSNAGYDEIYYNMGAILAQHLGQQEEGLKYFLTSLWINPLSLPLYNAMTNLYLRDTARYGDAAIDLLEQAVRIFPDEPNFLTNLGYLYRIKGEYPKAEDVLVRALRINPELEAAQRNLEEVVRVSGRPAPPVLKAVASMRELEARVARKDYSPATLELARSIVKEMPHATKAQFYLGSLEMIAGHPQEALAALEPLQGINAADPVLQRDLGEVYLSLGRTAQAVEAYRAALRGDPTNAYVRQRLTQLGVAP